jgi:hypothetical protein
MTQYIFSKISKYTVDDSSDKYAVPYPVWRNIYFGKIKYTVDDSSDKYAVPYLVWLSASVLYIF